MILILFYVGIAALVINGICSIVTAYCNYKVILYNKEAFIGKIREQADHIKYLEDKFMELSELKCGGCQETQKCPDTQKIELG